MVVLIRVPIGLAQVPCEIGELTPFPHEKFARFGMSLSLDGNIALVGAPLQYCPSGPNCGAVYVFRQTESGWIQEGMLKATSETAGNQFGRSVAVHGRTAVVAAIGAGCGTGDHCGEIYIFRNEDSKWVQTQQLVSGPATQVFGSTLALHGRWLALTKSGEQCPLGVNCHEGQLFYLDERSGLWNLVQTLPFPDSDVDDIWRPPLGMNGDLIIVGQRFDPCASGRLCGAASIYRFNGSEWVLEQELVASDRRTYDHFGSSVSIHGDVAIVGAPGDDCGSSVGSDCGAVYVFRYTAGSWIEEQRLFRWDTSLEGFGQVVKIEGNTALVTSSDGCSGSYHCGAAYVYHFDGTSWDDGLTITESIRAPGNSFGSFASVSNQTLLISSTGFNCSDGLDCGLAYIYSLGPDCDANGQADFCDIRDSGAVDGDGDGVPDACEVTASLDIEPGKCPNEVRPRERGVIEAALAETRYIGRR